MSVLSRLDRHSDLFSRMADTLGVDLAEEAQRGRASAETLRGAVVSCMSCRAATACGDWLNDHAAAGARETPEYCRNKAMLDRLAVA